MHQVNMETHRVNIWKFSRFRMGEHYRMAHSIINVRAEDPKADISTENNVQAFRQNSILTFYYIYIIFMFIFGQKKNLILMFKKIRD